MNRARSYSPLHHSLSSERREHKKMEVTRGKEECCVDYKGIVLFRYTFYVSHEIFTKHTTFLELKETTQQAR